MRIATINVRGLRQRRKRLSIFRQIRKKGIDICVIQEAYITDSDIRQWSVEWGGLLKAIPHNNRSRGLITLIGKNASIEDVEHVILPDVANRIQLVKFVFEGEQFCLFNTYAPNDVTQKIAFF